MKVKGKYSESAVLHAIILIAAAVISVIVFVVVLLVTGGGFGKPADKKDDKPSTTTTAQSEPEKTTGFTAGEDLANEMMDAAPELIKNNYYVLCLYYIEGLPHKDEPYGNAPEDGYYTVKSEEYTSLEQIESLVDKTYTKEAAEKIKTDPLGYGAIYKTRSNGTLGIISGYTPMPYTISWDSPRFEPHPVSETECDLTITVHDSSDNSEVKIDSKMVKTADGWRLTWPIIN